MEELSSNQDISHGSTQPDKVDGVQVGTGYVDDDKVMSVVEHLDELRTRLLRCLVAVALAVLFALFIAKKVVVFLEAPAGNITFQALSLEEPLVVYLKVALYTGLVLAFPYVLFEASQFVAPGLRRHERAILMPIVIGGPVLFVAGAAFAYLFILPPMLNFFGSFGQGISPINQRLDFYISLVSSVLVYMGLSFQLPIVIFALSFTGLVNSNQLLKVWKYAIFCASVIAAIITPDPTAFSMLLVLGALVGLYFLSIGLLKLFGR
ncbi:MAG: twin-arginine translocase subunit TatC [Candidatus Melainabacteria bacterium]|nr:twin-arginine translocase subunit TatC [Candidatus Melainabacteria bacterium]